MYTAKLVTLGFLAGQAMAYLATFDNAGANLNNIGDASFTQFQIYSDTARGNGVVAQSQPNFIQGTPQGSATGAPANGTMYLDTNGAYWGHLSNFYFACYTPAQFVPNSYSCYLTMYAVCYDLNDNLDTFTLLKQPYTQTNNKMEFVDLSGFYQNYASQGYFPGNGSTAACISYNFQAVPYQSGQFPVGFFLDSMTFTVTT